MEDAHKLLKIPKSECPDIWIRLPRHKWPKSWSSMENPVVPLERNLYGHPLAGLLWERQFEKILLKHGWEKIPNWECLFAHREKGLFLSVYVDDIKLTGKKQNPDSMWKLLNEEVDLEEPTSFLDHENLGCTQRQCQISKDIVDNYRTMFESRISAGGTEKLPFPQNLRISSWSCDMEGHSKKSVERDCELATKTSQQLHKVSSPCIDTPSLQRRRVEIRGRIVKVCSQNVLKCVYLARIGPPENLWSVNKFARSITKWTKACDKRLNRLISYIHHTCEYIIMWEILRTNADWDCFKTLTSREILKIQNPLLQEHCAFFGSHTFVPISCMCKKQTAVYGLLALELWDLIVSVFGSVSQISDRTGQLGNDVEEHHKSQRRNNVMENIDSVSSNVLSSRQEALLYVWKTMKQ